MSQMDKTLKFKEAQKREGKANFNSPNRKTFYPRFSKTLVFGLKIQS